MKRLFELYMAATSGQGKNDSNAIETILDGTFILPEWACYSETPTGITLKDLESNDVIEMTLKTSPILNINGVERTIESASSLSAGHGHKTITVYIDGERFSAVTNNMHDFDRCENNRDYYELIANQIEEEVITFFS